MANWRFSGASVLVLAAAMAAPALAAETAAPASEGVTMRQSADGGAAGETRRLQTVTVTAQRRDEDAQSIPVAVSAFTPEQLAASQVNSTLNLVRITPGLIGGNNTGLGSANVYFMRGLGNTESIATFDPPVGTYVDEIYITRQNANNYQLFDVQSLQVLRGPQGTLFGRNTTGGAIVVTNKKPADEFGFFIEGGVGDYERQIIRGSVDVPLSDSFRTKLSAYWLKDDGYVRNVNTGDKLNAEEAMGVRGSISWDITDSLTWDLGVDYTEQDKAAVGQFFNVSTQRSATSFGAENPKYTSRSGLRKGSCDGDVFRTYLVDRRGNCNLVETTSITSNFTWDAGFATVNFITGYRDLSQKFILDFLDTANGPQGGFVIANNGSHETFSQEIKLTGEIGDNIKWIGGVFYLTEENKTQFLDQFFVGIPFLLADRDLTSTTDTYAAYLQGDFKLHEDVTLTIGGRYTNEEKSIDYVKRNRSAGIAGWTLNPAFAGAGGVSTATLRAAGIPTKQTENRFTPRVALAWQAEDNVLLFLSATNGFKSGGWNARDPLAALTLPFGPEEVWSYEAGVKSEWFDGALRANATLYYMDIKDLQVISGFPTPTGGISFLTANAADMKAQGVELEFAAAPSDWLDLFVNLSGSDGKYKRGSRTNGCQLLGLVPGQRYDNNGNIVATGGRIASARGDLANCIGPQDAPVRYPDAQAAIGGTITVPVGESMGELKFTGSLSYTGRHWTDTANNDRDSGTGVLLRVTNVPATTIMNFGARYISESGNWEAAIDCSNCNEEYFSTSSLVGVGYPNDPRRVNFRIRYTY